MESMSKKRLKRRSEVWEHFDETPDGQRAICKYCSKSLIGNSKNGTSHLIRHLEKCLKHPTGDVNQSPTLVPGNESLNGDSMGGTSNLKRHLKSCKKRPQRNVINQSPTLVSGDETINMGLSWDKIREAEVKKVIIAEIPFISSDSKRIWQSLMGSTDIEKEIFPYYKHMKEKLAIELKDLTSRVSFSYEVLEKVGYISITAHFINGDFNMMRRLIGFKKLSNVHSEACITDAINSCISEWKLGDKIFTFISGGMSYSVEKSLLENVSSKMLLNGRFSNVDCCKEAVTAFCSDFFHNYERYHIKRFFTAIKTVPSRLAVFNEIAGDKGLSPVNIDWLNEYTGFCSDSDSEDLEHWEPAVKMFKEVILYKDVFCRYVEIAGSPTIEREGDSELVYLYLSQLVNANSSSMDTCTEAGRSSLSKSDLPTIDWSKVELAVQISDLFSKSIDGLSAFNHPTSSLCFPYIVEFRKLANNNIPFESIFEHLYNTDLFEIANALDPRYRLNFSKYFWTEEISNRYWDLDELIEEVFSAYQIEEIKETSLVCMEHTSREHQGSSSKYAPLSLGIIKDFSEYVTGIENIKKSELDKYLDDESVDLDDASFNLLDWWKQNRLRYPILSKMARDILAVPASVYSIEGIISSDFKAFKGLSPDLVEAVVCSKDWILSDVQSMPESNN